MEENNNDINQAVVNNELINNNPTPKVKGVKTLVLGISIGVMMTAALATSVYFYISSKNNSSKSVSKNITPTEIPTTAPPVTPTITAQQTQFGVLTWLAEPKKIAKPNISISSESLDLQMNESNFYQVGEFSDGSKLINGYLSFNMPGTYLVRFIESKGQYFYLNNYLEDYLQLDFPKSTTIKPLDLSINELNIPDSIKSGSLSFQKTYITSELFNSLNNPKKLSDSEYGSIYQVDTPIKDLSGVYAKDFYLRLKDNSLISYDLSDQPDQKEFSSSIILSNGSKPSDSYNQNLVMGCSVGGVGVPFTKSDSTVMSNKKEIGKTSSGKPVYQIMDPNSQFVKFLYNLYKVGREYPGASDILGINEFASKQNHLLWQDSQGDWQIFLSSEYSALAECGKPVIYLYPTKETQVKVQVGAQITKSEPTYPAAGWLVTAKPNGELTYQNQNYPYLFWEGLGNGIYPDYQDQGTLVSQKDLVSTVYKQLSQLGLNQKESADFMEFWQPRLPQTPYVRLTWLNTKDMDTLAPLNVSPKPDTNIRIFLEFEGLEKPIILKPQKLTAPARKGFTLIEWGGLLITPVK